MKVTEYIKNASDSLFSFEIIPPLKGKGIENLYEGIDPLMEFNPPFINVTYHREEFIYKNMGDCLLYTSPSPRDRQKSRMPSSA